MTTKDEEAMELGKRFCRWLQIYYLMHDYAGYRDLLDDMGVMASEKFLEKYLPVYKRFYKERTENLGNPQPVPHSQVDPRP